MDLPVSMTMAREVPLFEITGKDYENFRCALCDNLKPRNKHEVHITLFHPFLFRPLTPEVCTTCLNRPYKNTTRDLVRTYRGIGVLRYYSTPNDNGGYYFNVRPWVPLNFIPIVGNILAAIFRWRFRKNWPEIVSSFKLLGPDN